ncbi:hypothetical protein K2173_012030 [Erythroxylum novogranatense]|uniref:beta-galactosidase n=1 Tax=Erythroxylum novogranatense TaxID=1862640 RepID=A0AAV8TH80_9ROSI|nr:hypothetical protein K2173_012030 [Erythroxylum novogranatense]
MDLWFYMQNFTTKIVNLMKSEGLYASQGGPIILSQIENEYQNIENAFGEKGPLYVKWAATMAVGLDTGVPWIMCKQTDAPDPVINTCNGMKCGETFPGPNSPTKPSLWTENWTSFYQVFGDEPYLRSAQDIAFHVTLFIISKNGSYINYYMYHGGTNFGRTAASYMITSYYDQAPLDEYGLFRQPKWGHLKELHSAIKNCSATLLQGVQTNFSLGQLQQAYVYEEEQSGGCVAFLVSNDQRNNSIVEFRNRSFVVLPHSISILPDCENVAFNTAEVNTEQNQRINTPYLTFDAAEKWEEYRDAIPNFLDTSLRSDTILEHMNTTKDQSDYLWYTVSFQPNSSCTTPTLHVESAAHVAYAFVNNTNAGSAHGSFRSGPFTLEVPVVLNEGKNNISIMSVMVGLPDSGAFMEKRYAGLRIVQVQCNGGDFYNLTENHEWGYQVGILGENLEIYKQENLDKVVWTELTSSTDNSLTWFKTEFDSPTGNDPVALNLSSMDKGQAWVNGESIGRYWVSFLTSTGQPSQSLYHVPRAFLKESGNLLVILEESSGDPQQISLDTIAITKNDSSFHVQLI